jgi:hypothetical protein
MNFSPKRIFGFENERSDSRHEEIMNPISSRVHSEIVSLLKVPPAGPRITICKSWLSAFLEIHANMPVKLSWIFFIHARLYVAFGKALWCKHRRRLCCHYESELHKIEIQNLMKGQEIDSISNILHHSCPKYPVVMKFKMSYP